MMKHYFGMVRPPDFGAIIATQPEVPIVVNSDMPSYLLFQSGGSLLLKADVSGWRSFSWQKDSGQGFVDIPNSGSPEFTLSSNATSGNNGNYRFRAVSKYGHVVTGNVCEAVCAYLAFRNDVSPNDPAMVKVNDQQFNYTTTAAQRYISAYYTDAATGNQFTPKGLTSGRALASWQTDNATVAPTQDRVQANGQLSTRLTSGKATLTASVGYLSSKLSLTVN